MSNSRIPPREERRFTAADQAAYERRMRGLYGSQPTGGVRKELPEPGAPLELPRLPDDGTSVDAEPPGAVADDLGDQALARDGFSSGFGEDRGRDAGEISDADNFFPRAEFNALDYMVAQEMKRLTLANLYDT